MIDNTKGIEYDTDVMLERSYKDVPNRAITATKTDGGFKRTDFMSASKDFWLNHEGGKYYQRYNEGILNGTFNDRQPSFRTITETILEGLKNVIRIQCEAEDRTTEEFVDYIEMLENSFNLLSNKMDNTLDTKLEGEMIMAYFHAIFNSFITTNIKQKG